MIFKNAIYLKSKVNAHPYCEIISLMKRPIIVIIQNESKKILEINRKKTLKLWFGQLSLLIIYDLENFSKALDK